MYERSQVLARNLAPVTGERKKKACTDAQDRSHIATARGRSRSCPQGGGNDAGGSRRENVDNQERRVASGERRVHPSDAKHYREICGRCGCPCRDPRADKAVAPTSNSEAGRKIVRPLRSYSDDRRTGGWRPVAIARAVRPITQTQLHGVRGLSPSSPPITGRRRVGGRSIACKTRLAA